MGGAVRPSGCLAGRLREVREEQRLTQQQVADLIHLDRAAFAKIEGGTRGISLDEALDLCAVLGVSPRAMFFPQADAQAVELAPDVQVEARAARAWMDGRSPLRETDDPFRFEAQQGEDDRRLRRHPDLTRIRVLFAEAEDKLRAGEDDGTIRRVADAIYEAMLNTAKVTPIRKRRG